MNDSLLYLDNLKQVLTILGEIQDEITILKYREKEIREKIGEWLSANNIKDFETLDSTNKSLWRISIINSTKQSLDSERIKQLLTEDQLKEVLKFQEVESLRCVRVKDSKPTTKRNKTKSNFDIPSGKVE